MSGKLLNCPFCGGEAITEKHYVETRESYRYVVRCKRCLSQALHHENIGDAINFWNTRTPPSVSQDWEKEFDKEWPSFWTTDGSLKIYPHKIKEFIRGLLSDKPPSSGEEKYKICEHGKYLSINCRECFVKQEE